MKTLKNIVLAIFTIGLLMGVSQSNGEATTETYNHEINQSKVKLTALRERVRGAKVPSEG